MSNSPTEQARRNLEEVLSGRCIPVSDIRKYGSSENLMDDLMAWHLRHAPQPPTREAIKHIVLDRIPANCHYEPNDWKERVEQMIDHLLALFRPASLSQGSGPKVWCQHWEYVTEKYGKPGWYGTGKDLISNPDNSWDICPVKDCHAPRPEGGDGE